MRKIKTKEGYLERIYCPMTFNEARCDLCTTTCAWFHIKREQISENCGTGEKTFGNFAYCKDHCIGEVIE